MNSEEIVCKESLLYYLLWRFVVFVPNILLRIGNLNLPG